MKRWLRSGKGNGTAVVANYVAALQLRDTIVKREHEMEARILREGFEVPMARSYMWQPHLGHEQDEVRAVITAYGRALRMTLEEGMESVREVHAKREGRRVEVTKAIEQMGVDWETIS